MIHVRPGRVAINHSKGPTVLLVVVFFLGGGVILKNNILKVHMRKKKILAQDYRPKKISRTYSGLETKFWQDVPCADTLNVCIS